MSPLPHNTPPVWIPSIANTPKPVSEKQQGSVSQPLHPICFASLSYNQRNNVPRQTSGMPDVRGMPGSPFWWAEGNESITSARRNNCYARREIHSVPVEGVSSPTARDAAQRRDRHSYARLRGGGALLSEISNKRMVKFIPSWKQREAPDGF